MREPVTTDRMAKHANAAGHEQEIKHDTRAGSTHQLTRRKDRNYSDEIQMQSSKELPRRQFHIKRRTKDTND